MLGLVVKCGGARNGPNGKNGVGAAEVEGDGVFAVAAAIRGVNVEGASSTDEAGSVIRDAVAVGGGGSVDGAGDVNDVGGEIGVDDAGIVTVTVHRR